MGMKLRKYLTLHTIKFHIPNKFIFTSVSCYF
jgi:hypothetical protein